MLKRFVVLIFAWLLATTAAVQAQSCGSGG